MSDPDLKQRFDAAVASSKNLSERPGNMTLLELYALYKQASNGDAIGERPNFTDLVGGAKWDAWKKLEGRSGEQAMQEYVELVESLQ